MRRGEQSGGLSHVEDMASSGSHACATCRQLTADTVLLVGCGSQPQTLSRPTLCARDASHTPNEPWGRILLREQQRPTAMADGTETNWFRFPCFHPRTILRATLRASCSALYSSMVRMSFSFCRCGFVRVVVTEEWWLIDGKAHVLLSVARCVLRVGGREGKVHARPRQGRQGPGHQSSGSTASRWQVDMGSCSTSRRLMPGSMEQEQTMR